MTTHTFFLLLNLHPGKKQRGVIVTSTGGRERVVLWVGLSHLSEGKDNGLTGFAEAATPRVACDRLLRRGFGFSFFFYLQADLLQQATLK